MFYFEVKGQLLDIAIEGVQIVQEPEGKNTLPAIAYGVRMINERQEDAFIGVSQTEDGEVWWIGRHPQKYHKFHHEFDHLLMPSIGNAVSIPEYLSAYVAPFIMGAYILRPNETTFASSIGLIAFMNLIIHCQEMEHVPWLSFFVSPKNHIEHHKVRLKHYAAPTINVDYLLEHC